MDLIFVEYREPLYYKEDNRCKDLVEYFKRNLGKCIFVALTPYTVDQFTKEGFKGFIIPEYYGLWEEDARYGEWFRSWLEKLEQIVVSYHPNLTFFQDLDIPVTVHCMTMLKNMMDSYIRTTLQYFKILQAIKPQRQTILTDESEEAIDVIDDELYFKFPSIYYRLVTENFKTEYSTKQYRKNIFRQVADWGRCFQFLPSWRKDKPGLFASTIPDKIRETKLRGYKVKALPIFKYPDSFSSFPDPISNPLPLFQSIDEEFGFPAFTSQRMLQTRIQYFLTHILFALRFYIQRYEKYFKENDFQCLIFNRRNHLYQYGALIAARRIGLRTCYVRHGWDSFRDGRKGCWWRIEQRLRPFDCFVCPNELDREYYKPLGERYGCKVI